MDFPANDDEKFGAEKEAFAPEDGECVAEGCSIGAAEGEFGGALSTSAPRQDTYNIGRTAPKIQNVDTEVISHNKFDDDPEKSLCSSSKTSSSPGELAENKTTICFHYGDPEDPENWPRRRKFLIVGVGIITVINSTLGSALPSGAIGAITKDFGVTDVQQFPLPISLYLVGYVCGPVFFGPLSETYGRKPSMIFPFLVYTLATMACALAPNWGALLFFRFICGVSASSPITVVGGLYADIYDDPVTRGRAMTIFMTTTCFGPISAPSMSGYVVVINWRWTFWVGLIIAGLSWIPLAFMPETYAPVLLARRAAKMRKETGNPNIFAPLELEKKGVRQMLTVTLTRPLRMLFFEALVLFTSLYLSLGYAIFYMFFQAFPVVFQGIHGLSNGVAGFAFIPIGFGTVASCGVFLLWDRHLASRQRKNPSWVITGEYRRVPLVCFGGPLYVLSLFWLAWTARPDIHWIVPALSGLSFGTGFGLIFMGLINYLADAYETYSASAMAATSFSRSIFGAVLPFAARKMYAQLGVAWASSLLGFVALGMTAIPFAFMHYGDRIRARSKFCLALKEKKEREREEGRREGELQKQTSAGIIC